MKRWKTSIYNPSKTKPKPSTQQKKKEGEDEQQQKAVLAVSHQAEVNMLERSEQNNTYAYQLLLASTQSSVAFIWFFSTCQL